ncbi:MAG: hypothetical protein EAZ76_12935 [Nostocales cyanobacterium]|nr:MAG: hypothetical protein EAZ87_15390 [Nostocales cyanobacterium]TAF12905.1 MAG: hypothetical protein EAZ76_12935 [Nostocales cyanobacterium]
MSLIKLISVAVLLINVTACNSNSQQQATSEKQVITENQTVVTDSQASPKPAQKTGKMLIEGEETEIELKLYEQPKLFNTYFPSEDFLVESKTSEPQKEVKFIANFGGVKNENAYIQIVFPQSVKSVADVKKLITGKNGLMADKKWQIVTTKVNDKRYFWALEKIGFSKNPDIIGDIYIGDKNGKIFYVITHFPIEYADGFSPREDLILQNLEIIG